MALTAGFLAGMPPGPVLVLILQKALGGDRRGAIQCGVGSAIVDTSYVIAGFFALALVEDFIEHYQGWVMVVGGLVVAVVGYVLVRKNRPSSAPEINQPAAVPVTVHGAGTAKSALTNISTTALCALSNPGAFLFIMALVAILGFSPESCLIPCPAAFALVFAGEILWWTVLSGIASRFSGFKPETFNKISRLAGYVVMAFGVFLLVRGIILLM